jgi:hypothetical protein
MKVLLLVLGFLSAILLIVQAVMGILIRTGEASIGLRTAHFHSGTLMVLIALAYIALSLSVIYSKSRTDRP